MNSIIFYASFTYHFLSAAFENDIVFDCSAGSGHLEGPKPSPPPHADSSSLFSSNAPGCMSEVDT